MKPTNKRTAQITTEAEMINHFFINIWIGSIGNGNGPKLRSRKKIGNGRKWVE